MKTRKPAWRATLHCGLVLSWLLPAAIHGADANRLTHLDDNDPFYVGLSHPKLVTPQWVGEPGVEAVVILAIDDMREPARYETFLRPVLDRLKQIDGRAPVSIMVNAVTPTNALLQTWLKEGVSLEIHTLAHPCPCLAKNNFTNAANTFHGCVELLNQVPGNHPVAFRVPCCDSINSPSPRLYAEIFNQTNTAGQFLTLDSSVMQIFSTNDLALPRTLVMDADGREKFRKYLPFPSFVTTIENYPYPYVIGKLGWQFPAMVPSDWEAQNIHKPNNPVTVADWQSALDATVLKQGTFSFIFHPHGWIQNTQLVALIDYAVAKYGNKVKFLNFHEAQQRLDQHLLAGQPLRAANGQDNGVRLIDLNNDGYLDVLIGNEKLRRTRVWNPQTREWNETDCPTQLVEVEPGGNRRETGVRFGVVTGDGAATMFVRNETVAGAWRFAGGQWVREDFRLTGLEDNGQPVFTRRAGLDRGVRLHDVNRDGICEWIVGNETQRAVFGWSESPRRWSKLAWNLPPDTSIVDAQGRDNGLRFVDVNEDGFDDVIFSNEERFSLHLYMPAPLLGWTVGWTREVMKGRRGDAGEIPMIVRAGLQRNNGAWFHSKTMWVQNEETAQLKDLVDRRTFKELLAGIPTQPKSPQESLRSLSVKPGFTVELVANEPLVMDPVAFDWGADGKLWVVEMADYPLGIDGHGKPGGRVRFLEDTDGDGRYDKSTVFLDGLNFSNGVLPWRNGVIVSAAPEIFYAEDTDGDGKADVRRTILRGFTEGNQQHRVNGFEYGLDNWVYGANGDSGGRVRSLATGRELSISGRDFRFRPDDGAFETEAGQTQFGRHRDDWGNWFGNSNPIWLWHYVVPEHYAARNPHYAVRANKVMTANYPDATRLFAAGKSQQRFNVVGADNHVSAANSATPYRDELFGPEFATSVFISDPSYNLVHREILEPDGVSFTSHRAPDERDREFFSSTDTWFRPVMMKTGPDGALYVADMYRFVIEHPEWIPADFVKQMDLRAGHDKGRIYRIYPEGAKLRAIPRLDKLDTAGLVAALDSPNGWQRDAAQRLLVHQQGRGAVTALKELSVAAKNPKVRLQALCTLDGLNALTPDTLLPALRDSHPEVRQHAVRLSEVPLANAPQLGEALLSLVSDPSPRVRQQLAFTLGEWKDPRAGRALAELFVNTPDDAHLRTAVMTSAGPHVDAMLPVVAARPQRNKLLEPLLAQAAALGKDDAVLATLGAVMKSADTEPWQFTALAGFLDALDRRGLSLAQLQSSNGGIMRESIQGLDPLFAAARRVAANTMAREPDRLAAVRLLGRGVTSDDRDLETLGGLLALQNSPPLQQAALAGLGKLKGTMPANALLAAWKSSGPNTRTEIVEVLFRRAEWTLVLLDALESGKFSANALGPLQRQKLLGHAQPALRARAAKIFEASASDRRNAVQQYLGVSALKGDAAKGADLFRQNCAPCHRFHNEGNNVGVDLGTVSHKPVDYLLTAILDPNQAVEARYTSYTAVTRNDTEYSGIIASESANSVTLRMPGGAEAVLLRGDLKELTSSGRSLMPDGFEQGLNPQAMADLLAYLTAATPAKNFAGNQPVIVRPGADGALRLLASNCEIHGETLVFESGYRNLGYWQSENDRAMWTVEVDRDGDYDVWLDSAAPGNASRNSFRLDAGVMSLAGEVPVSGSWDVYRQVRLGRFQLRAGRQSLVFRGEPPLRGAMLDLREIRLLPPGQGW